MPAVPGFHRTRRGQTVGRFDEFDRAVLASLFDELVGLVTPDEADPPSDPLAAMVGIDAEVNRPVDPAVLRLFPDAYRDDDEASSDFRRFTERSLREEKLAHATLAHGTLMRGEDECVLSEEETQAWLLGLNDLRLALGTRLGVTEDDERRPSRGGQEDAEDTDDQGAADAALERAWAVYDWLTWLQESLVQTLLPH